MRLSSSVNTAIKIFGMGTDSMIEDKTAKRHKILHRVIVTLAILVGFVIGRNTATWTTPRSIMVAALSMLQATERLLAARPITIGVCAMGLILIGIYFLSMTAQYAAVRKAEQQRYDNSAYIDAEWRVVDVQRE